MHKKLLRLFAITILSALAILPASAQAQDAGQLIYGVYRESIFIEVFAYDPATDTQQALSWDDSGYGWLVDEDTIYIYGCLSRPIRILCLAPIDGLFDKQISEQLVQLFDAWKDEHSRPAFSPDGRYVVYTLLDRSNERSEFAPGQPAGIFLMNIDGSDVRALSSDGFLYTFSPDSTRLAYHCNGIGSLCIASADGDVLQAADFGKDVTVRDLAWSPDGEQVAFTLVADDAITGQLVIVETDDLASQQSVNLDIFPSGAWQPRWSPDGQQIMIQTTAGSTGAGEIYIVDRDGMNLRNLTNSPEVHDYFAAWSPDGNYVAYYSNMPDGICVNLHDLNNDTVRCIEKFHITATDIGLPMLLWLPD